MSGLNSFASKNDEKNSFNKLAIKVFEKMQLGDVKKTFADTSYIKDLINFKPHTSLENGIREFVKWYKNFYKFY